MSEKGQLNEAKSCEAPPKVNAIFGDSGSGARTEALGLLGDKNTVAAANQARECPLPMAHASDMLGKEDRFNDLLKAAKPEDKAFDASKALAEKPHDVKNDMVTAIDRTATSGRGVRQEFAEVHQPEQQKKQLAKVG